MRRLIQKELEDGIAMKMIEGYMHPISSVHVVASEDSLTISAL